MAAVKTQHGIFSTNNIKTRVTEGIGLQKARSGRPAGAGFQFVEKASLFHKPKPYLKWKRGLSPLFQAFFPLQPGFFLNQAAVF